MLPKPWQQIRGGGCRAGLTLNPATPFALLEPYLAQLDLLLIMTVHPGFGGQPFRADQMEKVRRARDWKAKNNPALDIEVDGGINPETARVSIENGANVLVAGTSIFKSDRLRRRNPRACAESNCFRERVRRCQCRHILVIPSSKRGTSPTLRDHTN